MVCRYAKEAVVASTVENAEVSSSFLASNPELAVVNRYVTSTTEREIVFSDFMAANPELNVARYYSLLR